MQITPIQTRVLKEGEDLSSFVAEHLKHLPEKSILVISSKIVALAEGRTVHNWNAQKRDMLIKESSDALLSHDYPPLTYQDGMYTAAAGIDTSNGNGALILPPQRAWDTAHTIRRALKKKYHCTNIGIIITDSMPLPGRRGVISHAIACAGFKPVKEYKGKKDIYGNFFQYSSANHADALAAAAGAVMGEGRERRPLAVITESVVTFTSKKTENNDITIPLKEDIYKPLALHVRKMIKKPFV